MKAFFGKRLTSGYAAEVETDASHLLAQLPEVLDSLTPAQRALLESVRPQIPFIWEEDFTRHVDARVLLDWYSQQITEAKLEGHGRMQAAAEIGRTLEKLFPAEVSDHSTLEERLERIAKAQTAHEENPRLRVVGVGGEGAVFMEAQGRGVYKLHCGGAEDAAMGVGNLVSDERGRLRAQLFRVPLTETIRRYCRQSILQIASPTEIKGVTENGRLITRQPALDAERVTTDEEITRMMETVGGERVQVDGNGKELRHCYVVPDRSGNWLLAVDLKPANVLRDKTTGELRLTDGVIAPLTPDIINANPSLTGYVATRPQDQF